MNIEKSVFKKDFFQEKIDSYYLLKEERQKKINLLIKLNTAFLVIMFVSFMCSLFLRIESIQGTTLFLLLMSAMNLGFLIGASVTEQNNKKMILVSKDFYNGLKNNHERLTQISDLCFDEKSQTIFTEIIDNIRNNKDDHTFQKYLDLLSAYHENENSKKYVESRNDFLKEIKAQPLKSDAKMILLK